MKKVMRMLIIATFSMSSAITGCTDDTEDNDDTVTDMNVSDTGQIECASGTDGNETMVSCNADSVAVKGQDGSYADVPHARSFSGPTAHSTFNGDYTTSDNVTGLVWRTCTQGQESTDATCDGNATGLTLEAADASCEALNSLNSGSGYAGINDWRLPTISELRTLVNYGESDPTIDEQYFPNTPSTDGNPDIDIWYWSSSEHRNPGNAFSVNFESGNVLWWIKQGTALVRCVSSNAVSDSAGELVWTKCSMNTVSATSEMDTTADCTDTPGRGTWQDALAACENLEFEGRTDWRLPSVSELHSLIDVTQAGDVFIDQDAFPDTPGSEAYYWSSTTYNGLPFEPCLDITQCAWYVNFNDGYVEGVKFRSQKDQQNYVRCVAGP